MSKNAIVIWVVLGLSMNMLHALDIEAAKLKFKQFTCELCHGADGKSNTPTGKAMKARDFTAEAFKQGDSVEAIMQTIQKGVPGTAMAAFTAISDEDRKILAEYILHLRKNAPAGAVAVANKPVPVAEKVAAEVPSKVAKAEKMVSDFKKDEALFKKGFEAYKKHTCHTCHGEDGKASTPTGKALKARNFTSDPFKQGRSEAGIKHSIKKGIPGTGMAAFASVPDEDMDAIAHYILVLAGGPDPDAPAIVETPEAAAPVEAKETISINYAIQLMSKDRQAFSTKFADTSPGYALYEKHCASCHGANGEGGVSVSMISAAPYYRLKTEPLLGHSGYWMESQGRFNELIVKGLPGKFMPGLGTLSKSDLQALYSFMKSCQARAK